jgi:outer membrane lipoprotein-sorting protein
MAGTGHKIWFGVLLSGMVSVGWGAAAQPVPLPPPAPLPKSSAAPVPPGSIPMPPGSIPTPPGSIPSKPGQPAVPQAQAKPPSDIPSWLPSIFGGKPAPKAGEASNLEPAQRALVDKISAYLSGVQMLSGDFSQIGPDHKQTTGQFYIQKPGKVRFEYDPPVPIDIVADGQSVVVRDRKLATQDLYPLSQTPLRFLLADRIDLLRDTNVVGVYADPIYVSVAIEEKQALIGTSKLLMMFDSKDLKLKQWTVTDPQGYDTTIAISNLDSNKRPDPNMFRIDYTRY